MKPHHPVIRRLPDGRIVRWCETMDHARRLALAMNEGLLTYDAAMSQRASRPRLAAERRAA